MQCILSTIKAVGKFIEDLDQIGLELKHSVYGESEFPMLSEGEHEGRYCVRHCPLVNNRKSARRSHL
jgi:hypothetical protein